MARKKSNSHVSSDFAGFIAEEGQFEAWTVAAINRVFAWRFEQAMKETDVWQAELARRMTTSRAVIHRLLDATDPSVTLSTISEVAAAPGRSARFRLPA